MNMGFDGIGTKVEIAEREGRHDTAAYDLFAMVCDDCPPRGAEPVIVGSILDVRSLGTDEHSHIELVKQLGRGYVEAAKDAGVAVVNGEIAELGGRVVGYSSPPGLMARLRQSARYLARGELEPAPGFHYNWGAGVVWFAKKDRMFTGREIKEGDYLVGLREDGPRSNGLSLIRKVCKKAHGREWHKEKPDSYSTKTLGGMALEPSRIYSKAVVEMFGGFDGEPQAEIHGISHITGGGIPGKLGRTLKPSGLGAYISDPLDPCYLMLYCQEKGGIEDREAYRTFNMGQGMIIITPDPVKVSMVAKKHNIDAVYMGTVTEKPGITIRSKGTRSRGKELVFD
jgi:phosphoribosylformylglycinamidine cyclo-ligase